MVRRCLVLTLHLLAILSVGAAFAADTQPHTPTSLEEVRPIADGLAETFQAINDGKIQQAVEKTWTMMGWDERTNVSSNERDVTLKKWESTLNQVAHFSQKFESIELVGTEPISSDAAFLHFVLICEKSPLSLRVPFFKFRGQWYIGGIDFAPSFVEKAATMREHMVKFPTPLRHPLTIAPALAVKPAETTTN